MRAQEIVRSTHSNSELTVAGVLAIFRQRKRVVAWTAGVLVLLVALYCIFATPRYSSTSVVEIQRSSNDLLDLGSMMGQSNEMGDAMNANLDLQTQIEILQSDTLALKVIKDLDLEKTKDFQPHWNPLGSILGLLSPKGNPDPVAVSLEDAPGRRSHATLVFESHLKVKPLVGTRLIEISFSSSNPKTAAAVVNNLTQALMDFGFNARNTETNQTSRWLNGQLSDLKKQAHDLQAKVVALQRDTGIYSLGEDSQGRDQVYSATLDQLQQATTSLSTATSSRIMKGALYDVIRNGDPQMISTLAGASMGASSSSVQNSMELLQNLRTQQSAAAAQLAQDTSKFGPDYPRLADERSNLASIDKAVNDEIKRIGERAKNDYQSALGAESKLQAIYVQRKTDAEKLNDRAIEYGIAKQESDNSRALYEDLSKRLNEAGVIEGLRSSNISVVSPAKVSSKPASPNPPLYLLGAVVLGLFFGACGALYSDMMDPTLQSFGTVEEALGVSLLAVLPSFSKKGLRDILPRSAKKLLAKPDSVSTNPVVVLDSPGGAFAEALRGLRLSLLSSRNGTPSRVILVTSSIPEEGKTTVAVNLAILLAQAGRSVLFVEADMRKPESTYLFDPSQGSVTGFSKLLSDPDRVMQTNPVTSAGRLQVLPSGPSTPHPTELLSTDRMRNLLDQWKLEFDHIVIDSPPLLEVTDALILAQLADMTLLVARYGFTSKRALERAFQTLESNTDAKIGVVLNAAERESVSYGDYYGYSGSTYHQAS